MHKRSKHDVAIIAGIAWYRAEDWSRLKAMFPEIDPKLKLGF